MGAIVSTLLGRPVWYELMTTDTGAAETFYRNVVGWTSAPFEGSPDPYTVFKRSAQVPVAGLLKVPEGTKAPPFWAMYVAVPKLEDAVAHIERLGGSQLSPVIEVPTVGRLQMMKDPQGASFYIIQPASREERPETAPEVGEASWHELMTTDAPAAMKFYSEIFGWQPSEALDMGTMGKYHMFNRPHGMIGGMMNKPPEMAQVPPHWMIYFRVPDINDAVERIKANGGKILNGPMEVPGGDWIVNAMDPQGAAFSLHAKKAQ
jgi:predicted enzyme related to lactoylglutathione lyase